MTIKTKYDIGDTVWVFSKSKPVETTISRITVRIDSSFIGESIQYGLSLIEIEQNRSSFYRGESELFPTKQELLGGLNVKEGK